MAAGPVLSKLREVPTPWGKKHRMLLMNVSFWMFWGAFPLAYYGGIRNEAAFINLSFALFVVACIVPLFTRK
jgi:hypothetical protein